MSGNHRRRGYQKYGEVEVSKSNIEWLRDPITGKKGDTINPVKGMCPIACSYCYARRMYKRFKWDPEIYPYAWTHEIPNKPSKIFMGSTMELFGDWIKSIWLEDMFKQVKLHPNHTFIFLTKQPQNLAQWARFPDNCWVGVSIDGTKNHIFKQMGYLSEIEAKVKFISFEPLLENIDMPVELSDSFHENGISWIIVGQQTPVSAKTQPKVEWVREIVEAADKAKVPVFLKNNLWDLLYSQAFDDDVFWANDKATLRQEFPK